MIADYSEVTAGLQKKIYALEGALRDNHYHIASQILSDLDVDWQLLIEFVNKKIEVKK
jgi:hypothetical protein